MPNYGLVVTPTYDPMSYADYAKPFEDYAKAYNAMVDAYDTLEMEANQWEKLANSDKDAPQYQQYKNYANDIRALASELATKGLSPKTRGDVSTMRQRYAGEIKPISDAWTAREKDIVLQKEAKVKNPYVRFDRDAENTGLGAYMGQTPTMQAVDLSQIKANVMTDAKPLADELRDLRNGNLTYERKWKTILGGQYYETVKRHGFNSDEVASAISQILQNGATSEEQYQALNEIVGGAIESSGVTSWDRYQNDPGFRREVTQAAVSGLWQAIGKTDFDELSNKYYDYLMRKRERQDEREIDLQQPRVVEEWVLTENEEDLTGNFGKYFTKQQDVAGNTIVDTITDEGIQALSKTTAGEPSKWGSVSAGTSGASMPVTMVEDRKFYDAMLEQAKIEDPRMSEVYFDELVKRANHESGTPQEQIDARKMLTRVYRKAERNKDMLGRRQFVFRVDSSTGTNLRSAINRELSKSKLNLQEVELDPKTGQYKTTKEGPKSIPETLDVIATSYSLMGNTVTVQDKDGKATTYKMPSGIDIVTEHNRDTYLQRAKRYADIIESDEFENYSEDLQRRIIEQYQQNLNSAHMAHSQLGFVNKVKNQENEVYPQ